MQNSRWSRPAPPRGRRTTREQGAGPNPFAREYEQGPWPAAVVPAATAEHLGLLERMLGRPVSAEEFATWERVRGYAGYSGPALDPALLAAQGLRAPAPPPPAASSTGRAVTPPSVASPAVNPHDLGDD